MAAVRPGKDGLDEHTIEEVGLEHVTLSLGEYHLRLDPAGDGRVRADSTPVDRSCLLRREELGHGRVALRTVDGGYLTMCPDEGQSFGLYRGDDLTPMAAFEEVHWPGGAVSLRSAELTYVAVDPDGRVTVNRTHPGRTARLHLARVPVGSGTPQAGPAVPTQPATGQSSTPRAASASPSSSAWRSDRMINGTA